MKVKVEIEIDTDTGKYDVRFWNVSNPEQSIIYTDLLPILEDVFNDNKREVTSGIDSDDQVLKDIH